MVYEEVLALESTHRYYIISFGCVRVLAILGDFMAVLVSTHVGIDFLDLVE